MAGTVTTTEETLGNVKKITFTWTASAGGAADATTTGYYSGTISAYTVPGTGTAPSDNYDIRLLDGDSIDVANGYLLNRDQTNTEFVSDANTGKIVGDQITLEVTNAGAGGEGTLIVFVSPVGMVTSTTTDAQIYAAQPRLATATNSSPLTTGTLWTYTGTIEIMHIVGRVGATAIQGQATTVQLSVTADALAAYNICGTKDLNAFLTGSLISITGTAANGAVSSTGVPAIAPGQANSVIATCTTSGVISVTFGAASTGIIHWYMLWRPLSSGATVV